MGSLEPPTTNDPAASETETLLKPTEQEQDRCLNCFRDMNVRLSTNAGAIVLIVYYAAMVSINSFAVVDGLMHKSVFHDWWMILIEFVLLAALTCEVTCRFLYHRFIEMIENPDSTYWTCANVFDLLLWGLSLVSLPLGFVLDNADEDDEAIGYIVLRVIRDAVIIVRTYVFLRTMILLQVTFCCAEQADEMGFHSSPRTKGKHAEVPETEDIPQSPGPWVKRTPTMSSADPPSPGSSPSGSSSGPPPPSPVPAALSLDSSMSNVGLEGEQTIL